MPEEKKLCELTDKQLEQVSGGESVQFDEWGNIAVGKWYTEDHAPGFIFMCTGIDVDLNALVISLHFNKYSYDAGSNNARDPQAITTAATDGCTYRDANAPNITL